LSGAAPDPATIQGSWSAPEPAAADQAPPIVAPRWGAWTPPPDERTITVGRVISEAWGTYKRAFVPLLAIGAVLGLLTILLSLPTVVYSLRTTEALIRVVIDVLDQNGNNYGITDPVLFQTQLQALALMPASTAITLAITDAAALGLAILGGAVLTSAAMTVRSGRRVSPAEAVGAVLARGSALVLPALLLAVGSAAVNLAIQFNQPTIQASRFETSETSTITTALSLAGIVVALAIFYLSVRWGLAIAAILAEGIGLRQGLRRSSELTRGHRLRLAGSVLVVGILQALTVTLPAVVIGLVIGFSVNAASTGIVSFTLASVIGSAIWAPFMPAVYVVAYDLLTERAAERAADPAGSLQPV
jgi:Membrane domain of glycerophosphoryl diester phosphodiesterase